MIELEVLQNTQEIDLEADNALASEIAALKVNKPLIGSTPTDGTDGQVLVTNGDGSTRWDDPDEIIDPTEIASAVTDWLDDNVDPVGSAVVVDVSLSIAGAAADAKVTGDAITDLKSDLDEQKEIIEQNEDAILDLQKIGDDCRIYVKTTDYTLYSGYRWGISNGVASKTEFAYGDAIEMDYNPLFQYRFVGKSNTNSTFAFRYTLEDGTSVAETVYNNGAIGIYPIAPPTGTVKLLITADNSVPRWFMEISTFESTTPLHKFTELVNNSNYVKTIDGSLILGDISSGNLTGSTTRMATPNLQEFTQNCYLTCDWTKYRIYVWAYYSGSWHGEGWTEGDIAVNLAKKYRFLVGRNSSINPQTGDLTAEEQAEIKAVTYYIYPNNSARKTGDFISICHQGYSETESLGNNILSGYALAKKYGFDYGECDIKLTSDNKLVCCHDASFVDATTGVTIVIEDHTLAELQTYDYYGTTIATFEEVLKACKTNGIGLAIDHINSVNIDYLFPIIKKYGMQKQVVYLIGWASGNPNYANNIFTKILNFYKKSWVMFMANPSTEDEIITYINDLTFGAEKVSVTVSYSNYTDSALADLIDELSGNVTVAVWTIDSIPTAKKYLPYVVAITSNKVSSYMILE